MKQTTIETEGQKPLVSICCLTYNHAPYIRRTLDGFLMQETEYPLEIVIHDDASTDGAQDIIRKYASRKPELYRLILQSENQWSKVGDAVTRNLIDAASGKYVLFCEGDDYWTDPQKINKQVDYMEAHPECSMCIHAVNVVNLAGESVIKTGEKHAAEGDRDFTADEIIGAQPGTTCTCSYCMRREYMENWPEFFKVADVGDYPLSILMAIHGTVHYMDEIMADYLEMHPGSWSDVTYKDMDRILQHARNRRQVLLLLNEYTNGQYEETIGAQVLQAEYHIASLSHDYKALTGRKLRTIVREHHGLRERIKFVLKRIFPFLEGIRSKK